MSSKAGVAIYHSKVLLKVDHRLA